MPCLNPCHVDFPAFSRLYFSYAHIEVISCVFGDSLPQWQCRAGPCRATGALFVLPSLDAQLITAVFEIAIVDCAIQLMDS